MVIQRSIRKYSYNCLCASYCHTRFQVIFQGRHPSKSQSYEVAITLHKIIWFLDQLLGVTGWWCLHDWDKHDVGLFIHSFSKIALIIFSFMPIWYKKNIVMGLDRISYWNMTLWWNWSGNTIEYMRYNKGDYYCPGNINLDHRHIEWNGLCPKSKYYWII